MKNYDYVRQGITNLKRRKTRTFLTSFAISIGTMLILMMLSLGFGVQKLVIDAVKRQANMTQITVLPYENTTSSVDTDLKDKVLTPDVLDKISNLGNIDSIQISLDSVLTKSEILGKTATTTSIIGFDLKKVVFSKFESESVKSKSKAGIIIVGRNLKIDDTDAVLLQQTYVDKLGIKDYKSLIGKEITLSASFPKGQGYPNVKPSVSKYKVVGIINKESSYHYDIITSINVTNKFQNFYMFVDDYFKKFGPNQVFVNAKDEDSVKKITDSIKSIGYKVTTYESTIAQVKSVFSIITAILLILGLIVIFVASLGVINTMTMTIFERTRSIGIMKALGASNSDIRKFFIVESGLLGANGGIMGLVFGFINMQIAQLLLAEYLKGKQIVEAINIFSFSPVIIIGSLAFAIFMSILAGLYPATKASKLNPVESLKYE